VNATLGTVVLAIAILTGLGAASAFLTSGRNRGRIDELRGDVADRDRRITFLEDENLRHEATGQRQEQVINHLQGEVETLRTLVTGQSGPTKELADLIRDRLSILDAKLDDLLALAGDKRTPPEMRR